MSDSSDRRVLVTFSRKKVSSKAFPQQKEIPGFRLGMTIFMFPYPSNTSLLTPTSSSFERASEISVSFIDYDIRAKEGDHPFAKATECRPLLSPGDDVDWG